MIDYKAEAEKSSQHVAVECSLTCWQRELIRDVMESLCRRVDEEATERALEEAAKVCDAVASNYEAAIEHARGLGRTIPRMANITAEECADAIRTRKEGR